MALQFDAFSAAAGSFTTANPTTWTHTPVGVPIAVIAFVLTDQWPGSGWVGSSITYGGVAVPRLASGQGTNTNFVSDVYYIVAGIPPGAQTVSINPNGGTLTKHAAVFTVSSTANGTAVFNFGQGNSISASTSPQATLSHVGTPGGWFGASAFDLSTATSGTGVMANETYAGGFSFGTDSAAYLYRTGNAPASSSTYGYSGITSCTATMSAIVVEEIPYPYLVPRRMPLGV